jgi:hypothetical protein
MFPLQTESDHCVIRMCIIKIFMLDLGRIIVMHELKRNGSMEIIV